VKPVVAIGWRRGQLPPVVLRLVVIVGPRIVGAGRYRAEAEKFFI